MQKLLGPFGPEGEGKGEGRYNAGGGATRLSLRKKAFLQDRGAHSMTRGSQISGLLLRACEGWGVLSVDACVQNYNLYT